MNSKSDGECSGEGGDAPPVSRRRISPLVSIISSPEAHIVRYKWADPRTVLVYVFLPVLLAAAIVTSVAPGSRAHVPSPVADFNILDYVAIAIGALAVSYFVAMLTFNKTTTVITGTTFSVQRGPIPCPWRGNYVRAVDEVREISYVPYYTVNVYGFVTYTLFVTFKDGAAARLCFLIFKRGEDERPAVELADQVQGWVEEKKQARRGEASGSPYPKALATAEAPTSRAQRLKAVASLLAALIALASLVATAEYFAARHRPVRRYERSREALRSPP